MDTDTADPEELLARLEGAGIVASDGDSVWLTEAFRQERSSARANIADNDGPSNTDLAAACERVVTDSGDELLPTAMAIEWMTDFDAATAAASALALARIEEPPDEAGVPEGFTPIRGEEIEAFLTRNPTAVLYFWGYDCDPCDALKQDFEELQKDGEVPDHVALAAICGEECYDLIRERYQVAVAPTTIFCVDGEPDSRLVGAHHRSTLRNEIEIIAG